MNQDPLYYERQKYSKCKVRELYYLVKIGIRNSNSNLFFDYKTKMIYNYIIMGLQILF